MEPCKVYLYKSVTRLNNSVMVHGTYLRLPSDAHSHGSTRNGASEVVCEWAVARLSSSVFGFISRFLFTDHLSYDNISYPFRVSYNYRLNWAIIRISQISICSHWVFSYNLPLSSTIYKKISTSRRHKMVRLYCTGGIFLIISLKSH